MATHAALGYPNGKIVSAISLHLSIADRQTMQFFCCTNGCSAPMFLVSAGDHRRAHFSSYSRKDHRFTECLRNDISFNPDQYAESLFHIAAFQEGILSSKSSPNPHNRLKQAGSASDMQETIGSGIKISVHTLSAFYAAFLHVGINGIYGDCKMSDYICGFDNYSDCKDGFFGFKIVELTYYRAIPQERAIVFNFPSFRTNNEYRLVKVYFDDEKDRLRIIRHFQQIRKKWLEPIVIAAKWSLSRNPDYISECTISKSTQHAYPVK